MVQDGTLAIGLDCGRTFDFAIEQLLTLPIPLKEIEINTSDNDSAVNYFISTITPVDQEQYTEEFNDLAEHLQEQLGLAPRMSPMAPPPLDLGDVEIISLDTLIPSSSIMVGLISGLMHLPNLKHLAMSGRQNRVGTYDDEFYSVDCFRGLKDLSDRLEIVDFCCYTPNVVSSLADLMRNSSILKTVRFESYRVSGITVIKEIADSLRFNHSIKSITLGRFEGFETLLDAIKGDEYCPNLNELVFKHRGVEDYDDAVRHFLLMKRLMPLLKKSDVSKMKAFEVYAECLDDTPVLYSLLRYRPELWCQTK